MKKKMIMVLTSMCLTISMLISGCSQNTAENNNAEKTENQEAVQEKSLFAGGEGTIESPWEIETAEQLDLVRNDLTAHYILSANIDLESITNFVPIGEFKPLSNAEEDAETPSTKDAFTGTFQGNGYKISNIKINETDSTGVGFFGCIAGDDASITDLTLENISVEGGNYTGGLVGYSYYNVEIKDINLEGKNDISGKFLVGGIAGASHSDLVNCTATANVILQGDEAQGAGIVVGGAEECSLENCQATGTVVSTGDGCYSIGGLAGCVHNGEYAKECVAENIKIDVGDNGYLVGGLLGHAGMDQGNSTEILDCTVNNVEITVGENTERIGGIVGGGFYAQKFIEYYPEPFAFKIVNSNASGVINGGKIVGSIAGYVYSNSNIESSESTVKINGVESNIIGGDSNTVSLEKLK